LLRIRHLGSKLPKNEIEKQKSKAKEKRKTFKHKKHFGEHY
jgi:hypothetical protein